MILSIKKDKIIVEIYSILDIFLKYWEKYLLTIGIEMADFGIKKGDYYFTTK